MYVRLSAANGGIVAGHLLITPSLSPHPLRQLQLEVSRSIEVSRSPGSLKARNTSSTSCENSNQGCD